MPAAAAERRRLAPTRPFTCPSVPDLQACTSAPLIHHRTRLEWPPMAVRPHSARASAAGRSVSVSLPASIFLAAALPILFLHVDYQPGFTVHTGTAAEHVVLSDLVLLAVGIAALVSGLRRGFAPLRAGWPIWIAGGIFLLDVAAGSVYPKLWASGYDAATHVVTAA